MSSTPGDAVGAAKRHHCQHCTLSFGYPNNLRYHMRQHHPEHCTDGRRKTAAANGVNGNNRENDDNQGEQQQRAGQQQTQQQARGALARQCSDCSAWLSTSAKLTRHRALHCPRRFGGAAAAAVAAEGEAVNPDDDPEEQSEQHQEQQAPTGPRRRARSEEPSAEDESDEDSGEESDGSSADVQRPAATAARRRRNVGRAVFHPCPFHGCGGVYRRRKNLKEHISRSHPNAVKLTALPSSHYFGF